MMKKVLGILLSLCMVMCFMPTVAFADSGLTDEQIAGATLIKADAEITPIPEKGDCVVYKFVPEVTAAYTFNYTSNGEFEGDFGVGVYNSENEEFYFGKNGSIGDSDGVLETSNGQSLEADSVYYIVFNAYGKCGFTSLKLTRVPAMNAKLKVGSKGKVYDHYEYVANGKKVKVTEINNSGAWGTQMYIIPAKGYILDGFYCEGDTLNHFVYNACTELETNEKYDGKTIEVKFRKATAAENKVRNTKITNLKATVTKGKVKVTWKSKGAKIQKYSYVFINNDTYIGEFTSKKTFTQTKDLDKGKTTRISVCGCNKVDGTEVYTDFVQIKVKAK